MDWFRFYTEVVHDPKIQRMPGERVKGWLNLLCLAAANDGVLPPVQDLAYYLRIAVGRAQELVEYLMERGLFDQTERGLMPHNWDGRQFRSDHSTERVQRFRNRHRNGSETFQKPPVAATETPPEQNRTDTETEQSRAETEQTVSASLPNWQTDELYVDVAGLVKSWGAPIVNEDWTRLFPRWNRLSGEQRVKVRDRIRACVEAEEQEAYFTPRALERLLDPSSGDMNRPVVRPRPYKSGAQRALENA